MIAFKSCPRCHGDLLVGKDDVTCIQCGHELRPEQKETLLAMLSSQQRKLPLAA